MTAKVPIAREEDTIGDVRRALRGAHEFETINYIYVLDGEGGLVGILSIKDVFRRPEHAKAGKICKRASLVTIHPEADQERAAYLALKNNIKALPVVDSTRRFLGVLPSDAILAILHREMHEDILHRAGLHHHGVHHEQALEDILRIPLLRSVTHRVPWLGIGLLGGLLIAQIVGLFGRTLEQNLLLAGYIPLVIYMSGAVGMQTATFVVRDLAMHNVRPLRKYVCKQFFATLLMAVLFSVGLFAVAALLHRDVALALVLGISLLMAISSSIISGFFLPFFFAKRGIDPANATGPMGTILQDVMGTTMYFAIATALL